MLPLTDEGGALDVRVMPPTLFRHRADKVFFSSSPRRPTRRLEIGTCCTRARSTPLFDHSPDERAGVQVFVRQDQDATTKVQRGMHSRFAARGRYSWQEASHVQFNRWLVDRYRRHWPKTTC